MATHKSGKEIKGYSINKSNAIFNWSSHQGVILKAGRWAEVMHNIEKTDVLSIGSRHRGIVNTSTEGGEVDQNHPGSWVEL